MENRNWLCSLPCSMVAVLTSLTLFTPCPLDKNTKKEKADLLVPGATVLTMNAERRIIADGAVAVRGDVIVPVGSRASVEAKYSSAQAVNAGGKLVLPGLINGHTHVPMTLLRGLKDDVTLEEWLTKFIFPAEARNVNEEFVRCGTRLAAAAQIRGAITTLTDMYYFEAAIAEETKAAGRR